MESVHVDHRKAFKSRMELHGHAQATEHHVGVTGLRSERLVRDL